MPITTPRLREYLAGLPKGLESYPGCTVRADVYVAHRQALASQVPRDAVPAALGELVHGKPGMWIPDVHGTSLVMLLRDAVFRDDASLMRFTYDAAKGLFDNPLYRVMMRVLSPTLILSGVGRRWGAFRTGSSLAAHPAVDAGGRRSTRLELTTEAGIYPRLMLETYAEAFRASIEMSGTRETRVVVAKVTPKVAEYEVSWRA